MSAVCAFVSKVAVDFENAIDATDNSALQEKFWRDAQEQLGVKCIRVGLERASACTTVHGLQHRGFNFDVTLGIKSVAKRLHDLRTNLHNFTCTVAHNEIDVAVTNAIFFAEFVVQVWQRANCLRGNLPLVNQD